MARTDKTAALADLEAGFRESNAALLTEYRGLTVAQLKTLRRSIASEAEYAVVKNTLTKIAAKRAGVDGLDEMLEGPSAIAFVKGDAINVAKALKNFAKEHPLLVIKGGYFDGKVVSADEVKKLADLESREVLLSKVAGALMATLSKAVRTIDALRASLEDGSEKPSEPVATQAPAQAEAPEVVAEEASAPAPAEAEVEAVESAETAETPAEETAETTEA